MTNEENENKYDVDGDDDGDTVPNYYYLLYNKKAFDDLRHNFSYEGNNICTNNLYKLHL